MGVERKHSKSNQGGKIRTENQNWAMPEGRTKNAKTAADLRYPTSPIPKSPPKFTKRPATYKIHNWDTWRPISMTTSQRDTPNSQEKYQISDYCWHLEPILLLSQEGYGPPASRRTELPLSSSPQEPTSVGPKGGTTGELLQEKATGSTTGEQIPEDRRARWISAMQGILQHLPQWLQQDDNYNRRDALSIMSDLPSSWPSCRLCINADAVATSYLAGLHRLFLEAKLGEKNHQTALQEANTRAYEMETICLDSLARHLRQLFLTDDDLFFDVYPDEWKQLQRLDFWQLSLMQEVSRVRRFIDKSTGKANLPQKTIKGVVHLQPRLYAPVDSLPTLQVIVTFPVTYLKVVLPRLPPIAINSCCTTDQASRRCPTSAHGQWSATLCCPSARLPTSLSCVLCTRELQMLRRSLSAMVEPDATFLRSSTCCSWCTEDCCECFW